MRRAYGNEFRLKAMRGGLWRRDSRTRGRGFTLGALSGRGDAVQRRVFILADGWDPSPFRHFAAKYTGLPGWQVSNMPCGHDIMVDMPNELAAALASLV